MLKNNANIMKKIEWKIVEKKKLNNKKKKSVENTSAHLSSSSWFNFLTTNKPINWYISV